MSDVGENRGYGASQGGSVTDLVTVQQQAVRVLGEMLRVFQTGFPGAWVDPPASSTSDGVAGQVAYDAAYLYVCVAPSSWGRIALTTVF